MSVEMEVPDDHWRPGQPVRREQLVLLAGEVLFCGDAPVGPPPRPGHSPGRLRKSDCGIEVVEL